MDAEDDDEVRKELEMKENLAKNINAEDDDLAIEMHEPYTYLNVIKF